MYERKVLYSLRSNLQVVCFPGLACLSSKRVVDRVVCDRNTSLYHIEEVDPRLAISSLPGRRIRFSRWHWQVRKKGDCVVHPKVLHQEINGTLIPIAVDKPGHRTLFFFRIPGFSLPPCRVPWLLDMETDSFLVHYNQRNSFLGHSKNIRNFFY